MKKNADFPDKERRREHRFSRLFLIGSGGLGRLGSRKMNSESEISGVTRDCSV